jgi:site-specific recombinase XerD
LTSAGEIVQDQLNNELQQCRTLLTLRAKENQNENTSKSYAPKQAEWRAWCTQKGYADGDIVTEDKIVLFLTTEIEGRLRKKGDKTKVVGSSTVEQYLNSLLDLYLLQVTSVSF